MQLLSFISIGFRWQRRRIAVRIVRHLRIKRKDREIQRLLGARIYQIAELVELIFYNFLVKVPLLRLSLLLEFLICSRWKCQLFRKFYFMILIITNAESLSLTNLYLFTFFNKWTLENLCKFIFLILQFTITPWAGQSIESYPKRSGNHFLCDSISIYIANCCI